jgi:hypothetical protein
MRKMLNSRGEKAIAKVGHDTDDDKIDRGRLSKTSRMLSI